MAERTPEEWRDDLYARLVARQPVLTKYDRYFDGKHPLAFATPKFRATFGGLFDAFADNWCPLVVEASSERLEVTGFRFGEDGDADREAWNVWQRNELDAESPLAIVEAVKLGEASLLVAPPERGDDVPRITVEHPSQMIVAKAAGDRRKRVAALKAWADESGLVFATLYTPTAVYKWQSTKTLSAGTLPGSITWEERAGVQHRTAHPFQTVPVVPIENSPTMLGGGVSDLKPVLPLQNAVNKLATDMLVASEYAAMPQRWATGVETPTDADGEPMDEATFLSFVGRVWHVEDPDARFGEFSAGDLGNYAGAIGLLIQHLSAQTRTPPHYLIGQIVNASGDALKAAETGLVSKVRRKVVHFGPAFAEAMRLGFVVVGDAQRGDRTVQRETLWKDPESRSIGEVVDAATKMQTLGVPDEALWEYIGATPQQIERWRKSRDAQLLAAQALAFAGVRPDDQGVPDEAPPEAIPVEVPDARKP